MNEVLRLPKNETGRDFVVGDIHGCFDALRRLLVYVKFDEAKDRLLSVGDLVDRGPSSAECVDWIEKPWFHAVRGNHEQMAIGVAAGRHDLGNYLQNGGGWFLSLSDRDQQNIAAVLDTLPYAIEVESPIGKVGIVHAECGGVSWSAFCDALENPESKTKLRNVTETALWARTKITYKDESPVDGVDWLIVGHTPLDHPERLGNVIYIDTGCVFGKNLTAVELSRPLLTFHWQPAQEPA